MRAVAFVALVACIESQPDPTEMVVYEIKRNESATGPIEVSVKDLPGGVNCPSIMIPAGQNAGTLQLTAGTFIALGTDVTSTIEATADVAQASAPVDLVLTEAPGALDVTFGVAGLVARTFYSGTEGGDATVVQPDGKVLVAARNTTNGTHYLTRYDEHGVLDTTFAGGSPLVFYSAASQRVRLALRPDGTIVIALAMGTVPDPITKVYAFTSSGSAVPGFGNTPTAAVLSAATIGNDFKLADMVVASDGSIYVGGTVNSNLAVVHFTPAGKLDTGFDGDGVAYADLGGSEEAFTLLRRSNGRLVIAGGTYTGGQYGSLALAQLTSDGAPDTSLPNQGRLIFDKGQWATFNVAKELPDGTLALFGSYASQLALFTVDSGGTGSMKVLPGGLSPGTRTFLDHDGGWFAVSDSGVEVEVSRLTFSGALDQTFGTQGHMSMPMAGCSFGDGVLDARGRLVFGASCTNAAQKSVFGRMWL